MREVGAEAVDFGDFDGAIDGGGDFGLGARGEVEGEEAALEFGFGLGGQSGDSGADTGQHDGLPEKWDGRGGWAAGDEEGISFADHVGADGCGWPGGTGDGFRRGARDRAWGGFGCGG